MNNEKISRCPYCDGLVEIKEYEEDKWHCVEHTCMEEDCNYHTILKYPKDNE